MIALGLIALMTALTGQQDQKVEPVDAGRFTIMQMTDDSCQAITSFEDGQIFFSFGENDAGKGHFVLIDQRWSGLNNNQSVTGTISTDGWKTSQPATFRAGHLESGKWMLDLITAPGFSGQLTKAKRVSVRIPSLNADQTFDIPEIGDIVTAIHQCNAKL